MKRLIPPLNSLRLRLTLWYVTVLGVILVGFSAVVYNAVRLSGLRELDVGLLATADLLASEVEDVGGIFRIGQLNPAQLPLQDELFFQLVTFQGQILVKSENLGERHLPLSQSALAAAARQQTFLEYVTWDDTSLRLLSRAFRAFEGGPVIGILQAGVSLHRVQHDLQRLRFWLLLIVPVTLLLTSLGGLFLADRLLRPLSHMITSARAISGHHLERRLPVHNPHDELGQLALTLNELFERLEAAFTQQQRFIADASHELRTPLAAMRAELEVALRRARSPEEYRALLHSALEEVKRLTRLAERLLLLAQSDAGQLPLHRGRVALDALARRVGDKLAPLAQEKGLALSLAEADGPTVPGDPELLEQVAFILVENAVKYTPQGGRVWVNWGRSATHAWLEVRDTGPGIAPEHLPHLFERFYRVDKARARAMGGAGLGLSIARSLVQAHGGRIEVRSQQGRGSAFRVWLPLDVLPPPH